MPPGRVRSIKEYFLHQNVTALHVGRFLLSDMEETVVIISFNITYSNSDEDKSELKNIPVLSLNDKGIFLK